MKPTCRSAPPDWRSSPRQRQRGATLIVALVLLVLLTMVALSSLNLGKTSLTVIGNLQFREEALSSASRVIEQVSGSAFASSPAAESIDVDLDGDSRTDYVVGVAEPRCVRAWQAAGASYSSLSLPTSMSVGSSWNSIWEIDATVNADENPGGAAVRVRAGVRVLLTQAQKEAVCP